jgi:nicotinate-nucleotide adenylyltransferase
MTQRKIVLFGGTFDPIHLGHTTVASCAFEHIGAEKIVFIPAKRSPLKMLFPMASDRDRVTMIALAIEDNAIFQLSDYELKKPAPSYTLETVRHFRAEYGTDISIYWLTGTDSIDELPHWYKVKELIDECNLATMYRAGCKPPDFSGFKETWGQERVEKLRRNIIKTPLVDISSTGIRKRLAAGRDVAHMLAPPVDRYIRQHNLYR